MGTWTPGPGSTAGDDTFTGDISNDTADGGLGNDFLIGNAGNDTLSGSDGGDTIYGDEQIGALHPSNGDDMLHGGAGDDVVAGGAGNDHLFGDDGNDQLFTSTTNFQAGVFGGSSDGGNGGFDVIDGGAGTDMAWIALGDFAGNITFALNPNVLTTIASDGTHTETIVNVEQIGFTAGSGDDTISGGALNDTIFGGEGSNTLNGGAGSDSLGAGAGDDSLFGGLGDDGLTYAGGVDHLDGGDGIDTLMFSSAIVGVTVDLNITTVQAGGFFVQNIEGVNATSGDDTVIGTAGNNTINGFGGSDNLQGGDGADILAASVGSISDGVTDTLDGGAGNDIIIGGGEDTLIGGTGNDAYFISGLGATVTEGAGAGVDIIHVALADVTTPVTYDLAAHANVEDLTFGGDYLNVTGLGTGADNDIEATLGAGGIATLRGFGGADILFMFGDATTVTTLDGGDGNDEIFGADGRDTLIGGAGADQLSGGSGSDTASYVSAIANVFASLSNSVSNTGDAAGDVYVSIENLTGSKFADHLIGNTGANVLDGGLGADVLAGGLGNDTYVVDNIGDVVTEAVNGGTDTVQSSISYTIAANVENLVIIGASGVSGTGNALANVITGNGANNTLNGGDGNDTLIGGAGADKLTGGNDVDIASYATATAGVTANLFDRALNTGDAAGDIFSSIEGLVGSAFNDTLVGNSAANKFDGGAGADTMIGGAGNDTYIVDNAGDVVSETLSASGGIDKVFSSISYTLGANLENLTFTGNAAIDGIGNSLDNTLYGNSAANTLNAGVGNDTLLGNGGHDILKGGAGADTFVFSSISAADSDTITDFISGSDKIQFDNAVLTALGPDGALASAAFWASTTGVAHDGDDRILYNTHTGQLYYDADGNGAGAAVLIATLSAHPAVAVTDIFII